MLHQAGLEFDRGEGRGAAAYEDVEQGIAFDLAEPIGQLRVEVNDVGVALGRRR